MRGLYLCALNTMSSASTHLLLNSVKQNMPFPRHMLLVIPFIIGVIVGRLIPAGTGLAYHNQRRRDHAQISDSELEVLAAPLASAEGEEVVGETVE